MKVPFSKIHGLGNDFIVVYEMDGDIVPEERKSEFTKNFCQRKLSVGADGVASVTKTIDRMRSKVESPQGVVIDYDSAANGETAGDSKMLKLMVPLLEAGV